MNETISADNPSAAGVDNPNSEPTAAANGTGIPSGQAPGGAPADDIFKGVDPNRLPPELKAVYNSMLTDYRSKTEKISETTKAEVEKAVQQYRDKASQYDQIAQQEEFVKQWNEYVQKAQATPQGDQSGDPVLSQMKGQLEELNMKIQISEMSQVTDAFAEAVDEKGERLHSDFDQLNSFNLGQLNNGQEGEEYSLLRACIELATGNSPQEKLANGYKQAKQLHDSIFEAGRKAGMGRLEKKALNGTNPPSHSIGDVLTVTEKKPKNAREALDMARRGQMVSRD